MLVRQKNAICIVLRCRWHDMWMSYVISRELLPMPFATDPRKV